MKKNKTTFVPEIIIPSLILIIGVALASGFYPQQTIHILNALKQSIFDNFSWFFVISISFFIIFLVFIAAGKYGSIKLGDNDSKPEYSFFSWIAMLFSAGLGIGLMYFGVAEPMTHYCAPQFHALGLPDSQIQAQMYTFFHWGIHAWAVYAVVGLALAYFTHRYKLPLSLRSAMYPLLKDKIHGWQGHLIDVFALCSTFFGLSASLGYGVLQLNSGFTSVGWLHESSFNYQVIIVVIVMCIAIASAISGIGKGVKILSQLNIIMAVILMIFVIMVGPTVKIFGWFSEGLGQYFDNFFKLTFNTHTFEPTWKSWFNDWTILYWAWWISWSPYVGLFIARISKGRTIREYIVAVLLVPSFFIFLWMTVFGNTAMWADSTYLHGALSSLIQTGKSDTVLFAFLNGLPWSSITSLLSILIIIVFYVTSADSGIFVMNNISTKDAKNSPQWQKAFWGMLMCVVALSLLRAGGVGGLMTMTLLSSLPFTIIIFIFCWSLVRSLNIDLKYHNTEFSPSMNAWSGSQWKERLESILTYSRRKDVKEFMDTVVMPAFETLKNELDINDITAEIDSVNSKKIKMQLSIHHDSMKDFIYGVKALPMKVSELLVNEDNAPNIEPKKVYIPFTYFHDGRDGYDIEYFNKEEIISDILKHYERYLAIVSDEDNNMIVTDSEM